MEKIIKLMKNGKINKIQKKKYLDFIYVKSASAHVVDWI